MAERKVYTFLNPEPLSRTVVLWLFIDLAMTAPLALASLLTIGETAADPTAPKDTPLPSDLLVGLVALGQVIVGLTVAFLVLKWIYRVNRNAHSVARGLDVSPPWAVGYYFIPIAFLWMPFKAMEQTWKVSTRSEGWRSVPTPSVLRWWWGLFLASNFIGQASLRISLMGQTLASTATSAGFDIAQCLISMPLDLVFIRVVRELTRRQVVELTFGGEAIDRASATPSPQGAGAV